MLEIRGLGKFLVWKDGIALDRFGSSKAEALLVYLAQEGGLSSRRALATMLWPESPEKNAQTSLRVALSVLRKKVGEYLEITREGVRINPESIVELDSFLLEQSLACGDISRAVDLYRGEWLQDIQIPDSNAFENWRRWEQEHLNMLMVNALQDALAVELARGRYQQAQELANMLISIDPLNETAHQRFLAALALEGKRNEALGHFQRFSLLLEEELEISPEDATEELVRLITKGDLDALKEQIVPRNNLPSPASSFIGRAAAISELKVQLGDPACRLLTLTGPGGVGKTRLAIEVSRSTLNLFADGVYFVALGDLPSSDFLVPAIASALCLNFDTIATHWGALDQLNHFLNPCKMLLVLDEFEGLLDQSSLISDLLRSAPGLKILVTSRQKLDLPGEWIYLLDGLSSSSTDTEALDLFQTRARQIDNSISFEGDERESALHICELVDGLPLGIELAASWTSVLTCSEIATEIEKGNGLLLTSSRSLPEKNRSLNATFDQSWHRLSAEQKKMFSHLSVFEGSFTRKAAKEVAGATLANLSALLNRSLISRNSAGRLEMHKVIRQYSGLKLSESIQEWSAVNQKCSQFYLELLASHEEDLNGPNMAQARELLRHEVLNLQAAMNWAVEHGEQEQVLDHLSNYFSFYLVHGWHQGVVAFEQLGKLIRTLRGHTQLLHDQVYLFVQTHLGYFLANLGRTVECEDICQECVESLKELKLVEDLAMCLHNLGVCAEFRGEYLLSQRFLEQAIEIGKEYPSNAYFSYFLWVGYVYFLVGEYEAGMQSFMICYQWWRDRDTKWAAAYALSKMGLASVGLGLHEDALAYYREAMEIFVDTGDVGGQAYSLSRMSVGSNFLEDYDQAVNYAAESLSLFQDIGHRWGICAAYSHLGFANLGQGELKVAEENFLSALERSVRYQLSPLTLYALCGVACTLALANNSDLALQIFTFARSHPKTPSLYITMAGRWIENSIHIREELSDKFRDRSIAEVVNDVLANIPIADQHK